MWNVLVTLYCTWLNERLKRRWPAEPSQLAKLSPAEYWVSREAFVRLFPGTTLPVGVNTFTLSNGTIVHLVE